MSGSQPTVDRSQPSPDPSRHGDGSSGDGGQRARSSTAWLRSLSLPGVLERLSLGRLAGVLVALVAVFIFFSVTQSSFLTWANFQNIIGANSVIFALSMGATLVVITGGIDLSPASLMTATSMMLAFMFAANWGVVPAVIAAVAFGTLGGLANGFLIGKAKISFLAVTLGALSIWQSFALVVNGGEPVALFTSHTFEPIKTFVNNGIGPIPLLLIFDIALLLVAGGLLRYTSFGRALFAIGSNTEAARLNGINVTAVLIAVYAIAGLTDGLGSIISVGRLTAGSPTVESTLLLEVLAAVLIGGTAFTGGVGGVFGTAVGVLFLGIVDNGLTLSHVSSFWRGTVSGSILIAAVGLGVLRDRGWTIRQLRASSRSPGAMTEAPAP